MKMKNLSSFFIIFILVSFCKLSLVEASSDYEQLLQKGSNLRQELITEEMFLSSLSNLPATRSPEGRIYLEILAQKQSENFRTRLQQWIDTNNQEIHPTTLKDHDIDTSMGTSKRLIQLQELGPEMKPQHYWITGGILAIAGLAYWGRNKEFSFQWKGF